MSNKKEKLERWERGSNKYILYSSIYLLCVGAFTYSVANVISLTMVLTKVFLSTVSLIFMGFSIMVFFRYLYCKTMQEIVKETD